MTLQRQVIFWILTLAVTVLLLAIFRAVLLPFVAGFALAYMLDPLADRLQRTGIGRLGASLIILILFVLVFIVALMVIVPLLGQQLGEFVDRLPSYVARLQQLAVEQGGPLIDRLGGANALSDIQKSVGNLMSQGIAWMGTFLQGLWSGGQALLGIFSLLVVTPVVAFYMLVDWDRMVSTVDSWMPMRNRDTIRAIARDIDRAIAGFVRGQALVCLILGTFYAVALTLLGLNFGAMIGMTSGILSFIPYVGSLTGLILSMGVAIVQFWPDWTLIVATLGIFVFGQFVEGNILSPKLVGESVGLHPVWLMFALLAFGSLFGFVGLLMAVPLAAAIGVIARFALQQYLTSPLYRGTEPVIITPKVDLDA
ncbi:AI-2E family transporter [Microvirga brassicacearum]|uniref:AI-2E family transporter n=1 Tax=Microvirga brassicacearum TaxID=2580413 RepID=A0A5N3PIP7_9HYPH|nr:AI-2E family transporter [Microvirga brassicacearum]KAB0269505.1 AI-2E family transporter [Microvirga brassicacearum]